MRRFQLGKRMLWCTDQHETLFAKESGLNLWPFARISDYAQINIPSIHGLVNLVDSDVFEVNLNL